MFMAGISGIIPGTNSVAVGAPDGTDPHWESTVLLLSCDGANGSDTFTDESFAARGTGDANVGSGNGAHVDTSVKKFGTGSMALDGTADQVQFADSADWHFTGDFTIETWARFTTVESADALISQWNSLANQRSWLLQYNGDAGTNNLAFSASNDGTATALTLSSNWTPVADTFYHLCVDRSGDVFRMYIDGTMVDKDTVVMTFHNSTTPLRIGCIFGAAGEVNFHNGFQDEIRITKGVARYASDGGFSVPTAAYPRS